MNAKIATILENLPHSPGSYQMLDKDKKVLYVGKAKDLYKRVNQYFKLAQNQRISRMVRLIDDISIIMTKTEKEALLLELNLIHKFMPPFNVLLKDDKQYPYIAIKKEIYPYLVVRRSDTNRSYHYYGPYTSGKAAWEIVNLLNRVFKLRKCKKVAHRACIYYHLDQCLAPCINHVGEEQINQILDDINAFLLGDNQKFIDDLEEKAASSLISGNQTLALDFLDMVEAIKHINQTQNVQNSDHISRDVINFDNSGDVVSVSIMNMREGKLLGKQRINFVQTSFDIEEEIVSLLLQYYKKHQAPKRLLLPVSKDNQELIESILKVAVATKAHDETTKSLLTIAKENATQDLKQYLLKSHIEHNALGLLEDLQDILGLSGLPLHIDLFDNSHIQGKSAVGGAITYLNGEPCKGLYRIYNLEHGGNDFENMMDVITRRLKRYVTDKKDLPNLLVVDGGQIQINAALIAMDNLEISIPIVGLVKNEKHQTHALLTSDGELISLEGNRDVFFFLTRMQDEVHRFAISGHKKKRAKSEAIGILDDIKGLGPKNKRNLMEHFPTIKAVREADLNDLSKVVSMEVAKRIKDRLNNSVE